MNSSAGIFAAARTQIVHIIKETLNANTRNDDYDHYDSDYWENLRKEVTFVLCNKKQQAAGSRLWQ